jgi:CRISPR-associated endoribonuclease Cas6
MVFSLCQYRFAFRALESVYFPPGKAGNVIRGALGGITSGPGRRARGPSGLREPPRPFVLRASHLDGKCFQRGATFWFDAHVFDLRSPVGTALESAFAALAETGLGPRRGRVELIHPVTSTAIQVDLAASAEKRDRITILFRTPTSLKGNSSRDTIPFGILMARIRDRLSTLRSSYAEGPLPIDFAAFAARAGLVRTVRCDLEYRDISRQSSRTGETHGIGGLTGTAEYEGDTGEFVPWLRAAFWTGVGRYTVWGNGVIEIAG